VHSHNYLKIQLSLTQPSSQNPGVFKERKLWFLPLKIRFKEKGDFRAHSKTASIKTPSNEIQKTQLGQRQHTRNQSSQFQNSQNSKCYIQNAQC
jgi:hypothetical protein